MIKPEDPGYLDDILCLLDNDKHLGNNVGQIKKQLHEVNISLMFGDFYLKNSFETLKKINNSINNCRNSLFVLGMYFEKIAENIDFEDTTEENQKIFLSSVNNALLNYEKGGFKRYDKLVTKYKKYMNNITEIRYIRLPSDIKC